MSESSKSFLSTIAALAFLGILGAVLARPIFSAGDAERTAERRPSEQPGRESRQANRSEPTPTPRETARPSARLVYRDYPKACLRPAPRSAGAGLVAAFHYGEPGGPNQISIGSPAGGPTATFAGMAPLQWSPSGEWLVSRGLELRDRSGRLYPLRVGGLEPWAWSPIADCLLVVAKDELVVIRPPDRTTVLVEGDIHYFGFTPEGRMLFTSTGAIDLSENPVRPIPAPSLFPTSCNVSRRLKQESCAPDGRLVAAISAGQLVLSDLRASFVRPLTNDSGWIDSFPEWGSSRTGVLFIRTPEEGGVPEVWFIAEGGNPRPTGLTLPDREGVGKNEWPSYLDWSVTPPDGSMPPILDE